MSFFASRGWLVMGILAAALGLRLLAALWWQHRLGDSEALGMPDSDGYWHLGQCLAEGRPYEYGGPDLRVFRAPGYPLLLAGIFRMWGTEAEVWRVRAVGAVLGALAVGGVMWLSCCLFPLEAGPDSAAAEGYHAALISGAMAAAYPGAIGMSVLVLSEALFCPLMLLHLICWVRASQVPAAWRSAAWGVGGGVAAAGAILTRPSWLLFIPFVLAAVLPWSSQRRRHVAVALWMVGAMCVTMSPWWVRNYCAVGQFVPTTLQVGASLYDGLNPRATGASDMSFTAAAYQAQKAEDAAAGRSAEGFEVRLDRRQRDEALTWARAHPLRVLQLAGHKMARMWNVWPNAQEYRSWGLRLAVAASYVPLLSLGLVGAWRWRRRGWPLVLCLLPAIYFTGLHAVFVSSLRYREPAMLVWLVLAAGVCAAYLQDRGIFGRVERPVWAPHGVR